MRRSQDALSIILILRVVSLHNAIFHCLIRILGYYASGFGCGVLVSVLTAPVHRVKVLLQTSNISAGKPASSVWGRSIASLADTLHCYKTVVADGGLRNL